MIRENINSRFNLINIIMLPPAILIVNYIFLSSVYFSNLKIFSIATITAAAIGRINAEVYFWQIGYIRKKYPSFEQTAKRIFLWILITVPVSPLIMVALYYVYKLLVFFDYSFAISQLYLAILAGFIIDILFLAINEGHYTFNKWKDTIQEGEQLKKANLQTQFNSLKNQVNPHFLFNCINTLSSLIHEDKERAEKFIDEMSNVYRYLLRNNEDELVALSTELKFLFSYYHLLKTRYGDRIEMRLQINNKTENYLLPPLTLQLLIENVVKHNNILKEKPLVIEISDTNNEWLVVRNNIERKTTKVDSSKIGLNNIRNKFRLLNQPEITINETTSDFIVMLPLITSLNKTN